MTPFLLPALLCLFGLDAPAEAVGASPPKAERLAARLLAQPLPASPAARARHEAVSEAEAGTYVGAVQLFPWAEGAVYRLDTAPGRLSDIALQPGETLASVAAGDTARWVIGDTSSGSGAARRPHVLVKPLTAGLATNLMIATDRRTYHVELRSSAGAAATGIAFTYPSDPLVAVRAAESMRAAEPVAADVAVEQLNFNYRIEGDDASWRPVRVFDDGRQVFIEFPPALAQGEAPPLFARSDSGLLELVNYRVKGHYYVVDRLFGSAELKLGGKRQQSVRITRSDGRPSARRSAS